MSEFTRQWITENSVKILESYSDAITLRQLYYRLVALRMTNDVSHYKKVIGAMGDARWKGDVDFEAFIDRDRSMYGETEAEAKTLETDGYTNRSTKNSVNTRPDNQIKITLHPCEAHRYKDKELGRNGSC